MKLQKVLIVVCMLFSSISFAATQAEPEQMAKDYFKYLQANDYAGAATLYRAADLALFKDVFMPVFELEAKSGTRDLLNSTFGQNAAVEDAYNATPKEFYGKVLGFIMNANPVGTVSLDEIKILGKVAEPDMGLMHVIARNYVSLGETKSNKVEILPFVQDQGTWKMVMPEQMKSMGQVILNQMKGSGLR